MYRTCLHCHGALGDNEIVEHFPVGKRLAYDAAKGRLWVVCPKCQRWNLTPIEERWEAIEECEREFEHTRMRVSTDNIVLARVRGGLDLVRIGAPSYPEFAAWRYGRILSERWKRAVVPGGALLGGIWTLQVLIQANTIAFGFGALGFAAVGGALFWRDRSEKQAKVRLPDGRITTVKHLGVDGVRVERDGNDSWALRLTDDVGTVRATGTDAVHAMRGILTSVNSTGGRQREISGAATLLDQLGGRDSVAKIAAAAERHAGGNVNFLPAEARLALEMALHEDSERAVLEGELTGLLEEWRRSDEIAGIADSMFLPVSVTRAIARMKGGSPR